MSIKQSTSDKNKTSEIDDHIRRSFDIKKRLGKGAYGIVWKAIDRRTQQVVAVKKIFDAFRNETDAQRTFREIMFLREFRNHPNIVRLHSIHRAGNHMDIYLSFEYMESDLHNVIKRGSILKDIHKRYVMYQLFNATNYIHSGNVIHRDMKPSNVLVDSKCRCKLADFGLARSLSKHQASDGSPVGTLEACLTDYVATRWYRAPEILIANKKYTKGIDMWSLGCILGEMMRGRPLFPGSCTVNQVECIVSALPEATEQDIKAVGNGFGSVLLNQPSKDPSNRNMSPKLDDLLIDSPTDAKHLIKSLLVLDPAKRLTARQALNHSYIEKFRNTSPELELNTDIIPPFRDDIQLTVSEYRSKLYEIMATAEKGTEKPTMSRKSSSHESPPQKESIASISASSAERKSIFTHSHPPTDRKLLVKQMSETNANVAKLHSSMANLKKIAAQQLINGKVQTNYGSNQSNHSSYTRLTDKLNCCKGCNGIQENGDSNNNNMKYPTRSTMPKVKNEKQPSSYGVLAMAPAQYNGTNGFTRRDSIDDIHRTDNGRRLSALDRRNTVDTPGFVNKATVKRCINENASNSIPDIRRQSLDGGHIFPSTSPRYTQSIVGDTRRSHSNGKPSMISNKQLPNRHGTGIIIPNYTTSMKTSDANSNHCIRKQHSTNSNDDYFDANSRLKTLEDKIRRHKVDVLEFVTEQQQVKSKNLLNELASRKSSKHTDYIGLANGHGGFAGSGSLGNLSDYNKNRNKAKGSAKMEMNYPDYGRAVAAKNKNMTSNANYGVISATDLLKLRSMSERIS